MKCLFCMVVLLAMIFSLAAAEGVDLTAMSETELTTLRDAIDAELERRAGAADTEADPITGTWYLTEVVLNGQPVDAATSGVSATMEVSPDGTFTLTVNGTRNTSMWSRDGEGYSLAGAEATLSDGKLTVADSSMQMVFVREEVEMSVTQAVDAGGEADFLGEWILDRIGQGGVIVPANASGESFDISLSVKAGCATITWKDLGRSWEFTSSAADGRLELTYIGTEDPVFDFSALEKMDDGCVRTIVSGENGIEPVELYFKKDPRFADPEPIPTFGLTTGMNRDEIVAQMESQGLKLFEEQSRPTDRGTDMYLAFYGNIRVFGYEATAVMIEPGINKIEYVFYFFDEEAGFRSRLPVADAKWYAVGELKGVYDDLCRTMVSLYGESEYEEPWWRVGTDYYMVSDNIDPDHMVIFSVH